MVLDKIKQFILPKNETQTIEPVLNEEQKALVVFEAFIESMRLHEGFPKKAISHLEDTLKTLKEIDLQSLGIQEQASIRKIIERDIPQMIELYLTLPRAHAVSFILENGKTSKDTLIEKLSDQAQQISSLWESAVVEKTNLLIKKQKATTQPMAIKKDFFDM